MLRALKDLEYERNVGKIGQADYLELSTRYREEARRLLRELNDAELPARARVEKLLARRLGGAARPPPRQAPPESEPEGADTELDSDTETAGDTESERAPEASGKPTCTECDTENDPTRASARSAERRWGEARAGPGERGPSADRARAGAGAPATGRIGSDAARAPAGAGLCCPGRGGAPRRAAARTDQNLPSAELPAGVIEARINDAQGNPLPGVATRLAVLRQSVSEGDAREFKTAISGTDGKVRFDGMATGANELPAHGEARGCRMPRHPSACVTTWGKPWCCTSTRSPPTFAASWSGMRGFVMVEPRDDVFQFEVLFRVFNVGAVTWVPDDLVIDLPRGWKGFKAQESMGDTRFVAEGDCGARLMGTFGPGQHDVVFRFQVPNQHDETVEFEMSLPPHVAEAQVMAEAAKGMGVEVSGMTPAQPTVRERRAPAAGHGAPAQAR